MGILSWVIFGLIVGVLTKWIMLGRDRSGFLMIILLGMVGVVVSGRISALFDFGKVDGFSFSSFVVAVVDATVVLFIYGRIKGQCLGCTKTAHRQPLLSFRGDVTTISAQC